MSAPTLCLKYGLKPSSFPGQRGQGGAAHGRLPFLGLLVSGLCSLCNSVAHLGAVLMEKFYFVHVVNLPTYKAQTGAVPWGFSPHNFSRCRLRCIYVQLVWLSSGFLLVYMWFSVHTYVCMYGLGLETQRCFPVLQVQENQ